MHATKWHNLTVHIYSNDVFTLGSILQLNPQSIVYLNHVQYFSSLQENPLKDYIEASIMLGYKK